MPRASKAPSLSRNRWTFGMSCERARTRSTACRKSVEVSRARSPRTASRSRPLTFVNGTTTAGSTSNVISIIWSSAAMSLMSRSASRCARSMRLGGMSRAAMLAEVSTRQMYRLPAPTPAFIAGRASANTSSASSSN